MNREPGKHAITFIFITVLVDVIGFAIIIPVLPPLIMELTGKPISEAAAYGGVLLFLYAFMQFIFSPILGNLSDRFGRRPILLLSLFVFGIDYLIAGFAPTLMWLFIGRTLAGIAGATYTPANAYIADITPPEDRAKRFGLLGAAFGLGFVMGPAIGGFLGEIGPRVPFFAAAGLAFANVIYGYFVLPETLKKEDRRPFRLARANPIGAWLNLRKYPMIIGFGGAIVFYQIAHDANPSVWSYYTMHKFDWSPRDVGASLAFVGILMALFQGLMIQPIVSRIGERRAYILGLSLSAVGFMGFAFASAGWVMYAWMIPWALMGISMPALRSIMSAEVSPDEQGELQGALTSLASLTAIIAPLMMTQLFRISSSDPTGFYFPGAPFVLASVLIVISILVFLYVTRRPFRQADKTTGT